jgi:hypothetical protein
MQKVDLKKQFKQFYKSSTREVSLVDVPEFNYLMIDGEGDPNTSKSFQDAIETLYPLSYSLKFSIKKSELEINYSVLPLEALWWSDDMSSFETNDKEKWKWTLMIMQPNFITTDLVNEAIETVGRKKNPTALRLVRFEKLIEGKSAQIMHIGPFSEEGPTIRKVHNFIEESGSKLRGKHHEIYLSDMRKADPEKWKTIIRQPIS